jgi:hypothetical protein
MILLSKVLEGGVIDFSVLRPSQEFFTYMETSPLSVKGFKIEAYARHLGPLSREGSLSCHTCCDTGPLFFRSHPKNHPHSAASCNTQQDVEDLFFRTLILTGTHSVASTTLKRILRNYSYLDPHGSHKKERIKKGDI